MTEAEKIAAIASIDADLASATGWGSWMVGVANYREQLVNELRQAGVVVPHKHQARTDAGGRVS